MRPDAHHSIGLDGWKQAFLALVSYTAMRDNKSARKPLAM